MISVLICSVHPQLLANVKENIRQTIGVPFEVISVDNKDANKGLCQVYNELAKRAIHDHLCFLHEDVLLKTENWGCKMLELFSVDSNIGLVGVAGSKYKSAYFSGWYSGIKSLDCANYYHQYQNGGEQVFLSPNGESKNEDVVCIDGVMMCCTKIAWQQTLFDDRMLKGFHFYDIDFSLRVARKYRVLVTYEVDLIHITSGGDYSNKWVETAISYHREKSELLPFSKIDLDRKKADIRIAVTTMDHLKNYKISLSNKFRWIRLQKLYSNPVFFYPIVKFLLYQPLGLKAIHKNLKRK